MVAIDHTYGRFFQQIDTMGIVHVSGTPARQDNGTSFTTLHEQRATIADIDRFRRYFDRPPDKELMIRFKAENLPFVVDRFLRFDSIYFTRSSGAGRCR